MPKPKPPMKAEPKAKVRKSRTIRKVRTVGTCKDDLQVERPDVGDPSEMIPCLFPGIEYCSRGGRRWRQIKAALEAKGVVVEDLYWQPIGKCIEMQGREGGWWFYGEKEGHTFLGFNVEQALADIAEMEGSGPLVDPIIDDEDDDDDPRKAGE